MQSPAVTIVVVPRDHFSDTRESLESIYAHSDTDFELIYVDGNSPPAIARYLHEQSLARGFRLVRAEHYLSPNQARNLGASYVDTRYTVFIDNDVVVASNWLEPLVRCADETGASIVGPLNFEGRPLHTRVHFSGGEARIVEAELNGWTERRIVDKIFKNVPAARQRTGCAEFHCMMVRTADLRRIGGLDEKMMSTRENLDLCMAIAAAGGTIYVEPRSRVTYLAPVAMALADVPYFALRWSDAWDLASFDHLRRKWHLEEDSYFHRQYRNLGWRRRGLMMRAGLLRWLPHWRLRAGAEWCLRPIERRVNGIIAKRHADRHGAAPIAG
jgi:GT2 family glycosyltransferase